MKRIEVVVEGGSGSRPSTASGSRVALVGNLPPPVHGAAVVNDHLFRVMNVAGCHPQVYNTASRSLSRTWASRIARIVSIMPVLFSFAVAAIRGRIERQYVGLSGGSGQIIDASVVALGRVAGATTYLHHHSYAYITRPTTVSRLLMFAGGPKAVHIVPCPDMRHRLRRSCRGIGSLGTRTEASDAST